MMKRPMLQAAIAYCVGIVLAYYIREIFIIIVIFPVLMFLLWYCAKRSISLKKAFCLVGYL